MVYGNKCGDLFWIHRIVYMISTGLREVLSVNFMSFELWDIWMEHSLRGRNVNVSSLEWAAYLRVCLYLLWEQVCYVCHHRAVSVPLLVREPLFNSSWH